MPNLACVPGEKPWKEMDDKDFVFSLYPNDLIRITAKKDMKFSVVNKNSTLPANKYDNEVLAYYVKAGISTASLLLKLMTAHILFRVAVLNHWLISKSLLLTRLEMLIK